MERSRDRDVMAGFGSVIFSLMVLVGPLLVSPLLVGHLLDEFGWVAAVYTLVFGSLLLTISIWLFRLNRKPAPAATAYRQE